MGEYGLVPSSELAASVLISEVDEDLNQNSRPIYLSTSDKSDVSPFSIEGDECRGGHIPAIGTAKDHKKKRRHFFEIGLFSVTTFLLFADQNLMAPNLTAIAEEYGFSDNERDRKLGGDISFAFFLFGAPASILIGCLADSTSFNKCNIRSKLFALVVGIGEGACFLTFFSTTYMQLFICRAFTGVSIGGALPLIYSILGDLYVADERYIVNSIVSIGTGGGLGVGQAMAGFLGPTFGWRSPFLLASVPALICALIVSVAVKDPKRGAMEEVVIHQRKQEPNQNNDGLIDNHLHFEKQINKTQPLKNEFDTDVEIFEMETECLNSSNATMQASGQFLKTLGLVSARISSSEEDQNGTADEYQFEFSNNIDSFVLNKHESFRGILGLGSWLGPHVKTLIFILSTPTAVLAIIQGAPGSLPWGIILVYLNDFLAEDRGMTVEHATVVLFCFAIGHFGGVTLGGAGGVYLYRMDKRYPALLAGFSAVLGCFPFWVLLNGVNSNSPSWHAGTLSITAGILSGITGPIINATLQNVTLPDARGQAFAIFNTFNDIGSGFGPVILSVMIAKLGGRTHAFNIGTLAWVLCGILNLAIFFTVESDERRIQTKLSMILAAAETKTTATTTWKKARRKNGNCEFIR